MGQVWFLGFSFTQGSPVIINIIIINKGEVQRVFLSEPNLQANIPHLTTQSIQVIVIIWRLNVRSLLAHKQNDHDLC